MPAESLAGLNVRQLPCYFDHHSAEQSYSALKSNAAVGISTGCRRSGRLIGKAPTFSASSTSQSNSHGASKRKLSITSSNNSKSDKRQKSEDTTAASAPPSKAADEKSESAEESKDGAF